MMNMGAPLESSMGVMAFGEYACVIDARSPREYAEDHLPGAVNWPVVDDGQYAEVGIRYKADSAGALAFGIELAKANMRAFDEQVAMLLKRDARKVLVYCFRGGKRSSLWADRLMECGFPKERVHVLAGGWKNYRRWVRAMLEAVPAGLTYRVLSGSTGAGKTRLLHALRAVGEQVLDLEAIARHRGSLIGGLPNESQPTQKHFDTLLLDELKRFDPGRVVWIEAESKKVGNVQLPAALCDAMHATVPLIIEAPMAERVKLWREDYAHFVRDPESMVRMLEPLKPLVGSDVLGAWWELARAGRTDELFERVMLDHYDPCYERSGRRSYQRRTEGARVRLDSVESAALRGVARRLAESARREML
jgi:tRNA 2-selenouridine synthase